MAVLSSVEDLLPLLGSVVDSDDPIAALERSGHSFSPALKARLRPRAVTNAAQRRAWKRLASKAGRVHFTVGRRPRIVARALEPGEFEFSAGVRMPIANEVLAGLHNNGVIPDTIFLDELLSVGDRTLLEGGFVIDRPGGRIGRLLITAPPTIAPIRDGFDRVHFNLPFRLNFERITSVMTGQIRTVVTFATGTFRLSVGLLATPSPGVVARTLEIQIDLSDSIDARIDVDPSSPVQLADPPGPGEIQGFAVILQNALKQRMADLLRITVSAAIPLPLGKLTIHRVAIVTRGDALLAGVKVQGTGGTGNPDTLVPFFPSADANYFTRVHDSVLRLIVQAAARSGQLTQIAKGTHPDAVIDSADVAFGPGTIRIMATGKIVDLCPLGVDLGFTVTTTVTVTLDGTRIIIEKDTSKDLDNLDAFLCVITSLGLALLAAVAVVVSQGIGLASGFAAGAAFGVVGVLTLMLEFDGTDLSLVLGGDGDGGPTIIDLDDPIPGTDLLPTIRGAFVRLDDSTMLVGGRLGVRVDTVNTYFYMRFLSADSVGVARALKGATVRLMDRDSPGPAGDDVSLPGPSTTSSGHMTPQGPIAIKKETRFERTPDETFGTATTDHTGRIRIYVPKGKLASKGGQKVVKTTRTNLDTEHETVSTVRTAIAEPLPDFYFRVTRPDGSVLDTLSLSPGFFLNFQSRSVGSPSNPVTVTFGGGFGPIVVDPVIA